MSASKVLPYSVAEFFDDVEREFKFLGDRFGFEESASKWTSHRDDFGFREHVTTAIPSVTYAASLREVVVTHDPRGAVEVVVRVMYPDALSLSIQEIATRANGLRPEQYGEIYDMTIGTAAGRIKSLAEGLARYGEVWLREPQAP